MKYTVYRHTNLVNGKSYIGVTGTKPEKRWKDGRGYMRQPKFFNAILKYGWEGFSHEIVAVCESMEIAYEIEILLIEKFDCINNGYNTAKGGRDITCVSEKTAIDKYNLDTGELICTYPSASDAASDVGTSDSHIYECCQGKHKTAAGYGWAYHGNAYKVPTKCYRYSKIEQVDPKTLDVVSTYASQKEAAKASGVSKALINLCCKGKLNTGAGYIWRYAS